MKKRTDIKDFYPIAGGNLKISTELAYITNNI